MNTAKHSPLPWRINQNAGFEDIIVAGPTPYSSAILNCSGNELLSGGPRKDEAIANAALIVKSVNLLPELVAALEILVIKTSSDPMLMMGLQMTNEQINKMALELLKKARQ